MQQDGAPQRTLGLTTATTIIVGAMIGSGILILPADMLAKLPSPPLVLLIFVVAAALTAIGALTVAELSGMYPKAGGQYVYLREAFGPFPAYLFGWTTFWIIQTGTIAAVAAAFAKVLGRFVPLGGYKATLGFLILPPYGEAFVAIGLILLFTIINFFGVRWGGLVSNVSTIAKSAGLLLIVLVVFFVGHAAVGAFSPAVPLHQDLPVVGQAMSGSQVFAGFVVALTLILFAYDGWYSATYVAAEMRNPKRDGPLSLLLGPVITTVIYLGVAAASMYAVNLQDSLHLAGNEYLAGRAVENALAGSGTIFGTSWSTVGVVAVSALALVSIAGTVNAYVLTAPRIAYAQARDGLFMASMARLHPKHGTPGYGSILCGLWACILVMSGLYDQLVTAVIFAVFLFHVLTAWAMLRLRRTRPDVERPFRTPGGPTIPLLFMATSAFIVIMTLLLPDYRNYALLELGVIGIGVPAYFLQQRSFRKRAAAQGLAIPE